MNHAHCACANAMEMQAYGTFADQLGMVGLSLSAPGQGMGDLVSDLKQSFAQGDEYPIEPGTTQDDLDKYQPEVWQKNPPQGSTPGAVAVVGSAWSFEHKPYATYRVQGGDTLVGLAKTYLGDGARFKEIWAVQDGDYKQGHTVDKIYVGDLLNMPDEAAQKAKAWLEADPSHRSDKPGYMTTSGKSSWWKWVLGGAAVAATVTVAAWGASVVAHKTKARRRVVHAY